MAVSIRVSGLYENADQVARAHAQRGWQCQECYGVQVDRFEDRFGGVSNDRFECRECGCTWHREE